MNQLLDDSLVGLVLLGSALYALSALGPRNVRRRVLAAFAALLTRAPAGLRLGPAAQRLARAAEANAQGACGGCGNCGSATPAAKTGDEIKVPISSIPRSRHLQQD
jgi:hypothetical protein